MGRADSNGNAVSIPRGIRDPEENFERAGEGFIGIELCKCVRAKQSSRLFLNRDAVHVAWQV